jgi:hypothetical protein
MELMTSASAILSRHAGVLHPRLHHLQQRRRHPRGGTGHQRPRPAGNLQHRARVYRLAGEVIDDAQINSVPSSLTLGQPLLEIRPRWERLGTGLPHPDFGFAAAALSDGAFVDEFFLNDDKVDMFLFSEAADRQELEAGESPRLFARRAP